MTIRLRIMLLALVAIICLSLLMVSKSVEIHADVNGLEKRLHAIEKAMGASRLIHSLQQERGLSAGFLVRSDPGPMEKLSLQQGETDADMAAFQGVRALDPKTLQWIDDFRLKLAATRLKITDRRTDWLEVRRFFTEAIAHMLDSLTAQVLLDGGRHAHESLGIIELGAARENLGLIRATLNRVYTRTKALPADVVDIARYLGAFQAHFHAFMRDLEPDRRQRIMTRIGVDQFKAVIGEVEHAMTTAGKELPQRSPAQWWEEVTAVIDAMKEVEDSFSGAIENRVGAAVNDRQADLTRYIIAAVSLTVLMTVMVVLTLMRILRALSVLLNALGAVIDTQDFSIRIGSETLTKDEFGRISYSINKLLDYTDALIQKKDRLASIDELTGLFNRRSFQEKTEWEMKRAARYRRPLCFIMCDIDHFKKVNDDHGHAVGDDVLVRVAALFREKVRSSDLIGRWGGEEFVILAVESDLAVGAALAEKLRKALEELSVPTVGQITCSFGVALWRGRDEGIGSFCARADAALYKAKAEGRNRVAAL